MVLSCYDGNICKNVDYYNHIPRLGYQSDEISGTLQSKIFLKEKVDTIVNIVTVITGI